MKKKIIILIIFVFVGGRTLLASDADAILQEFEKLNIKVTSPAAVAEEEFPAEFTGPYWGLLNKICKDSGWDLSAYAGKKISLSRFAIEEKYGNDPLDICVISCEGKIVCIYKTVREGSDLVPGILPVENPIKKESGKRP